MTIIWSAPRGAQRQHAFPVSPAGSRAGKPVVSVCGKTELRGPITEADNDATKNPHKWTKAHCVRCKTKLERQRIKKGTASTPFRSVLLAQDVARDLGIDVDALNAGVPSVPAPRLSLPEAILKRPYHRVLVPSEEGGFTATMMEFPGCIAEGDSLSAAYANLERAARAWVDAAIEQGYQIPEPNDL